MPRFENRTAGSTFIVGTDLPQRKEEVKQFRRPDFAVEVLGMAVGSLLSFGLIGIGIQSGWIAFTITGVGTQLSLFFTYGVYLREVNKTRKDTTHMQKVEAYPAPEPAREAIFNKGSKSKAIPLRRPKTLTGKDEDGNKIAYTFEGWQLDKLLEWFQDAEQDPLKANHRYLRREWSTRGPGLYEQLRIPKGAFGRVRALFIYHEYIEEDDNRMTDKMLNFLSFV